MATTDEGARQYIAENAGDIISEIEEMRDEWHEETWNEAHQDGKDAGVNEERQELRDNFSEQILGLHDRLAKAKDGDTSLRKECRELLEQFIDEYAIK